LKSRCDTRLPSLMVNPLSAKLLSMKAFALGWNAGAKAQRQEMLESAWALSNTFTVEMVDALEATPLVTLDDAKEGGK
jgi:hypothetical protein